MKVGDIIKNEKISCGIVCFIDKENGHVNAVAIYDELEIECDKNVLNNIKNEEYIQDNFKVNIKEVKEDWYRVKFDKKSCELCGSK